MRLGVSGVIEQARQVVGDAPVYGSIDVDGFDPAYAAGTGTPKVGGITPREGLASRVEWTADRRGRRGRSRTRVRSTHVRRVAHEIPQAAK